MSPKEKKLLLEVDNLSKKYTRQKNRGVSFPTLTDSLANFFAKKKNVSAPKTETFWALKNLSFSLDSGETLGVVGKNGAGKSTLFKLISRITTATTGTIKLYGRVSSLLEVGTGFHPELSGRENVFLSGAVLGMKHKEVAKHFQEIVDFADIWEAIDEPVKHYSSGMYMRLGFAIAAHLTSEIMIVDEVLAVGDSAFQKKCLQKMEDIVRHEKRTVLMVSHNLESVRKLCNKCLWLEKGELKLFGETDEVLREYEKSLSDVK